MTEAEANILINFFIPERYRTLFEKIAGKRTKKSALLKEMLDHFDVEGREPREVYREIFGHYPFETSESSEG